jgi:hypothetical protein
MNRYDLAGINIDIYGIYPSGIGYTLYAFVFKDTTLTESSVNGAYTHIYLMSYMQEVALVALTSMVDSDIVIAITIGRDGILIAIQQREIGRIQMEGIIYYLWSGKRYVYRNNLTGISIYINCV